MTDIEEAEVAEVQALAEKHDSDEDKVDFSGASQKLAEGLLSIYQLPLEQVKKELNELTCKQEALLTQMQFENQRLRDTIDHTELNEMFQTIKAYQSKLAMIKKEMTWIHERTFKLKKRTLRLQQIKQKEALHREQQREQEIRREQELIGKPTTN